MGKQSLKKDKKCFYQDRTCLICLEEISENKEYSNEKYEENFDKVKQKNFEENKNMYDIYSMNFKIESEKIKKIDLPKEENFHENNILREINKNNLFSFPPPNFLILIKIKLKLIIILSKIKIILKKI